MHWTVAASFIHDLNLTTSTWLTPFVKNHQHHFTIIPRCVPLASWHTRKSSVTDLKEWMDHWFQASDALHRTHGGVITVFPQLAAAVAMQKHLLRKDAPVVAWMYNVGTCSSGVRRLLAQKSSQAIDRFVVHTQRERQIYSDWLELPIERFEFVPYQVPEIPVTYEENTAQPFIAALGSAHRDFPALFEAVKTLNIPTIVAASKRSLEGISVPSQVQTPFDIGKQDCLRLAQEARISVVPMVPNEQITAAGQVTIVEAMRMGRALIATRCNGAEDYIIDGETGLLVEPHSVKDLTDAIQKLWEDHELRNRLGQNAMRYAAEHFSNEAAGAALDRILTEVANQVGERSVAASTETSSVMSLRLAQP
ncbi:glycosyltransferase family 4 protein [Leptolyngbya sp. FACHB-711]|uniref:glycosyltransferase family 4 protein n=1 Tax=unclassified Leptolyngbya TaxID=2650499 RepID=UPI0016862440|nr:glycosyltransferase family 4 protein [Leptolyngbya sp. FACHB-711]MBD1851512.1 glycosyltransferase family 4 protein [Cyanobacteria bacterium FACHB-502]MBD2024191.1 glycosyltransferase family 4 protein [Leptolyngbya sp. FACHB-711]